MKGKGTMSYSKKKPNTNVDPWAGPYTFLLGVKVMDGDAEGIVVQVDDEHVLIRYNAQQFVNRHSREDDADIEQENWID